MLALLVLAGGLVLRHLARSRLESALSAALGVPVSIGGLSVSLRADVGLSDIAIGRDGGGPTIERLDVDPDLRRVLHGELVLNRVALHGLRGTIELGEGGAAVRGIPTAEGGGGSVTPVPVRELVVRDSELTTVLPASVRRTPGKLLIDRLLAWQVPTTEPDAAGFVATVEGSLDGLPVRAQATADIGAKERRIDAAAEISEMPIESAAIALPPSLRSLQGTLAGRADYHLDSAADRAVLTLDLQASDLAATLDSGVSLAAHHVSVSGLELEPRHGWTWHGDRLEVSDGRVTLAPGAKPLAIEVESIAMRDLGRDAPGATEIVGRLGQTGTLHGSGKLGLDPVTIDLRIELASLSLPEVADLLGPLPLAIARGSAAGKLTLAGNLERYRVAGTLELAQVHTRAPDPARPEEVLAVDRVDATFAYSPAEKTGLSVSRVVLNYPYAMVQRRADGLFPLTELSKPAAALPPATPAKAARAGQASRQAASPAPIAPAAVAANQIAAALSTGPTGPTGATSPTASPSAKVGAPVESEPAAAAPSHADAEPSPPLRIVVADLQIVAGRVDYLDTTLTPTYWSGLSNLAGSVSGFSWPGLGFTRLQLTGLHDELSAIRISAESPADRLRAHASADGLSLPGFNPYLSPLIGYRLDSGTATLNVDGALGTESFGGEVKIALENLAIVQTGLDVVDRQTGVPLPVALALMKDYSGKVELTVPVQGDRRSGDLQLGSLFSQALGRAILAAITSPIRLLGMLFGSDGPPHALSIDPIPFASGEGSLDAAGKDRLTQIRRIMGSHPELLLIAKAQLSAADRAAAGPSHLDSLAHERQEAVRQSLVGGGATGLSGAITHAIESARKAVHAEPAAPSGQPAAAAPPPLEASRVVIAPWKADENPAGDPISGVYVELQAR